MDSTQRTRPRTGGSPVGLVVFIILTVVFAVVAYWAFASYQSTMTELKKAQEAQKGASAAEKKALDQVDAWKKVTGVETPDALKESITNILATAKNEGYGAGAQDTAKDALATGLNALSQTKIAYDSLKGNYEAELAAHKSLEEQKKAGDETYVAELGAKAAEIQNLQKQLDDDKAAYQAKIDQEIATREALRNQYYNDQDAWREKETKLSLNIAKLQEKNRDLSGEGTILEKASGYVTAIDLRNRVATVNMGSSSGVKAGMRFVVFSKDSTGKAIKKGVIEIVRVWEKVSAGRIVAEEPDMKVGKRDLVYNLAGPKKKLFVFAGTPKEYTIDVWKDFIGSSGGEVVDKVRQGDQVADYLVLCTFDEQKDTDVQNMIFEARDLSVKIVKEADLKGSLGF